MLRLFKKEGRKEKNKLYNVSRKLNLCLLGFLFVLFDFPQKFNDPSLNMISIDLSNIYFIYAIK